MYKVKAKAKAKAKASGLQGQGQTSEVKAMIFCPRGPHPCFFHVHERIQFKLATLTFRSLRGLAPRYFADDLRRVADMPSRRSLRSSTSHQLDVPRTRLVSVGDRSFSSAGSRLWNSLPREVVECQTVETFRQKLKHFLFSLSFPGH